VTPDDRLPRIRAARSLRWIEFVAAAAGFLVLSVVAGLPVTGSVAPALLVGAVVAAAGVLIAVFVGMLRDLGELERRIVAEALALAFVATISAMFAYPFLEGIGMPSLRPQTVAFVLVTSFAVGIARSSRRYE
jgi:hypothetical protein